jgi:DNA-binding MurR/RpiR family transcriptional regulator
MYPGRVHSLWALMVGLDGAAAGGSDVEGSGLAVRQAVEQAYARLTPGEKRLADLILQRPWRVVDLSVQRLARDAGVGTSVVSRFSRRIGQPDYRGLRLALARELGEAAAREGVGPVGAQPAPAREIDPVWGAALESAARDLDAVRRSVGSLDPAALSAAAHVLAGASRVIALGGGDSSGGIARRFARMLVRQGWRARAEIEPRDATWAEDVDPGDAVLLISHRGNSPEICDSLPAIKARGARIVALTNEPQSPIGRAAEVVVATAIPGQVDDVSYVLEPVFPVQVVTARALVAAAVAARRALTNA